MPRPAKNSLLKRFFSVLGPGLVTGAADNDPSGIATYSIVGAQLGMSLLWTAFVTWPLMGFVQLMCARIGMVTGRGLAGALRQIWPRGHDAWQSLVAVLGTTISPYLFFWQASQEVEEEKAMGRRMLVSREGATKREILGRQIDVGAGTFFSNLVMYFIILTTALTLYPHNERNIESSRQVAEALQPLAGPFAATLYTVGLIGVGLLAIPILAGSSAYAFAETLAWKQGLDKPVRSARYFYGVISVSTLLGIAMVFLKISPIKALFGASVINGVLAPFLLVGILVVASDRKLMQRQPSPWLSRIVVGLTAAIMLIAAGAMFFL